MAKIGYRIEFLVIQIFVFFINLLSRRAALRVGRFLGLFSWYLLPMRKRLVLENLEIAFPDKAAAWKKQTAKECYKQMAMTFIEMSRMHNMSQEIFDEYISVQGHEILRPLGWNEKPLIFCLSHIGNWETGCPFLMYNDFRIASIAKKIHNPHFDKWVNDARKHVGVDIIYVHEPRRIVTHLRKIKSAVGFVCDQDARKNGVFIDFFGKPASTFTGPAYFSLRFNVPMLPVFQYRCEDPAKHVFIIREPILPPPVDDPAEQAKLMMIEYNKQLEEFIREHPAQYFWFHKRWKTQPK